MNVAHLLTEAAKDRPLTTILVRALEAYISQSKRTGPQPVYLEDGGNPRSFLGLIMGMIGSQVLGVRPVNRIFKAGRRLVKMGPVDSPEAPPWLSRPARSTGRLSSLISAARD